VDEFLGWYTHVAELLGAVVAITEGDLAVLEGFDPAVGDGDPEDIARQVLQDLGAGSGVLGVDDPGLPPHLSGDLVIEAQGLEGIAHLGAEDDRERAHGDQEGEVFGADPMLAVGAETTGADQEVRVRVIQHRPGPGVEDRQDGGRSPQPSGIGGELEDRTGGTPQECAVHGLLVTEGEGAQLGREGEREQEVR
jgi:hypothetical protein